MGPQQSVVEVLLNSPDVRVALAGFVALVTCMATLLEGEARAQAASMVAWAVLCFGLAVGAFHAFHDAGRGAPKTTKAA